MARTTRQWLCLALWTCSLLQWATQRAWSDGVVRDGVGATSVGRGGTNIAHSDNGAVLLDNPAAMVNIPSTTYFELGIDAISTDLDYSDPENSTNARFRPMPLPQLSYMKRSPDGSWAAGLGVFLPAGFGAKYDLLTAPTNPFMGRHGYKSLGVLAKVLPAVAWKLSDRLSVGGSFGVGISHLELEAPMFLQTGLLTGAPSILDLQATGAAPTWSLGTQYKLSESTTFGLAYISETRFRLDGSLDADIFIPGLGVVQSDFDAQVDIVWPRSVGLGLLHQLNDCTQISADLLWFDWSHAFDRLDLKLTSATNPIVPAIVGPRVRDSFPLDWYDSVSLRLGYERSLTPCDVLRVGYTFVSTTVPSSTLTPLIPATLEHNFSVGYGKRLGSCRLDLAYQFAFGPERHVSGSRFVGGDFDFSESKAQAHWLNLSLAYEF